MVEVTFVGENGLVTMPVPSTVSIADMVEQGYLAEWVPGVYEFTETGRVYFTTRSMFG